MSDKHDSLGINECSIHVMENTDAAYYKSVIVLGAGGTINMSGKKERKPSKKVEQIIQEIKKEMEKLNIDILYEDVFERPPDSSNVGEEEWSTLFQKVSRIIERKRKIESSLMRKGIKLERGGIVITHGTDTLQTSSMMLSLLVSNAGINVPIIFTASFDTLDCDKSDARSNLKKSLYAAKERFIDTDNMLPTGVYVLIGQDIHIASRLTKVYTIPNSEGYYFFSFPAPVGQITGKDYHIRLDKEYLIKIKKTGKEHPFDASISNEYGIVEHEVIDIFTSITIIDDLKRRVNYYRSDPSLDNKNIGVVIQGNFSRNVNFKKIVMELFSLHKQGCSLWVGSLEVYRGAQREVGEKFLNLIHRSLSHSKAREKLSWLLGGNVTGNNLIKWMSTNVAGEIFETSELPEWINYETFPERVDGKELVVVYPNIQSRVYEDAINRLNQSERMRKKTLSIYGFGDGHIPAPNTLISEIVSDYLQKEGDIGVSLNHLPDSLENLVEAVTEHVKKIDSEIILGYLCVNYQMQMSVLKSAVYSELSSEIKSAALLRLRNQITDIFQKVHLDDGLPCDVQRLDVAAETAMAGIKLLVDQKVLSGTWREMFDSIDNRSAFRFLADRFPGLIAKRLIHEAVAFSHPSLKLIGKATDQGIHVEMKTLATKSRTNLELYEIGNMLQILGADSDIRRGWNTRYLLKKCRA
ncbi:MAG: asparaginase [Candidatus Sabulitectum sp.]|nr:asparaginase [Candidatus Sabulitectum sp.]